MNYDVWGSWSPDVGPNAPLDDSCAPVQAGSATSALKAWTNAKFPAAQVNGMWIINVKMLLKGTLLLL
jgi:chitinase